MDIGALSHEQLLQLIIFSGAGSLLLAVVFVGALVINLRKFRKPKESTNITADDAAPVPTPVIEGEIPMPLLKSYGKQEPEPTSELPSETSKQQSVELMRVLMNPDTGKIMLEVDGVRYDELKAITSRTVGQRILEAAAAVLNFTHGIMATANGTQSVPVPTVSISPIAAPQSPAVKSPAPESEPAPTISSHDLAARKQFLDELETQAQAARRKNPSPRSRWGGNRKKVKPTEDSEKVASFDLAGQIDDIVQEKWPTSGVSDKVKIHSVPGGGMRIQVGQKFYDTLDAVENSVARELIQSAIKAWEAK